MKSKEPIGVREIAKKANVSIATVDRVLNNRTGVSVATKKKINDIIKKYDYQPNILARRLASKKIFRIATLIPAVSSETQFWQSPLQGIEMGEEEIKDFGIVIEKFFFDLDDKNSFVKESNKILRGNFNGVLLAPSFIEESKKFSLLCDQKKIPYVFINSDIPELSNLSYIGPELYQSGYMGAHLVSYILKENQSVLLVNISKILESFHHVLRKEDGFRSYYATHPKKINILKTDIRKTDYASIKKSLLDIFKKHTVNVVFVTNSRVFYVARFLKEENIKNISVIGFDFTEKNLNYLVDGHIDFLLCQKSQEQGYKGILALYNYLVRNEKPKKTNYMSIDVITRENYKYYNN